MTARPAIVTTLKHPSPSVLEFFVLYHQAIGFEHLFLFFDDPEDPTLAQAQAYPGVTAIPNDDRLKSAWTHSPQYARLKKILYDHPARQTLNCELAIALSYEAGYDWLLHIDIDELFYSSSSSAVAHYGELNANQIDRIVYMNFEAVPESEVIGNYFEDVTLFKKNPILEGRRRFNKHQEGLLKDLVKRYGLIPYHGYFLYYVLGKSAARVTPDLRMRHPSAWGLHRFSHWSDGGRNSKFAGDNQLVLHYACCGFESFWQRYERDKRLLRFIPRLFAHDAFKVRQRNDVDGARRLYRDVVMLRDHVDELLAADILCRIEEPARMWKMSHDPMDAPTKAPGEARSVGL